MTPRRTTALALSVLLAACNFPGTPTTSLSPTLAPSPTLLPPREQAVARLAARGQTNQQIAEVLVVSTETVKTHVRNVLGKFGVRSKVELRVLFLDLGIRWWDWTR